MAPAGDMATEESMAQSFSLANMAPQYAINNFKAWTGIEKATRKIWVVFRLHVDIQFVRSETKIAAGQPCLCSDQASGAIRGKWLDILSLPAESGVSTDIYIKEVIPDISGIEMNLPWQEKS